MPSVTYHHSLRRIRQNQQRIPLLLPGVLGMILALVIVMWIYDYRQHSHLTHLNHQHHLIQQQIDAIHHDIDHLCEGNQAARKWRDQRLAIIPNLQNMSETEYYMVRAANERMDRQKDFTRPQIQTLAIEAFTLKHQQDQITLRIQTHPKPLFFYKK